MWSDIKYWFLHRYHPSHQYNRIKIKSLDPGYYDPDVRMLHACFDLYTEWFYYNAVIKGLIDKETVSEDNPDLWDEMVELYKWWTVIKPESDRNEFVSIDNEEAKEDKEDEMLMRLMKIRKHIWYL